MKTYPCQTCRTNWNPALVDASKGFDVSDGVIWGCPSCPEKCPEKLVPGCAEDFTVAPSLATKLVRREQIEGNYFAWYFGHCRGMSTEIRARSAQLHEVSKNLAAACSSMHVGECDALDLGLLPERRETY